MNRQFIIQELEQHLQCCAAGVGLFVSPESCNGFAITELDCTQTTCKSCLEPFIALPSVTHVVHALDPPPKNKLLDEYSGSGDSCLLCDRRLLSFIFTCAMVGPSAVEIVGS